MLFLLLFCFVYCFVKVSSRFLSWTGFHRSLTATLRPLNSCRVLTVTDGLSLPTWWTVHFQLWFCLPLTLCILALRAREGQMHADRLHAHAHTEAETFICTWLITTLNLLCVCEHFNEFLNLLRLVDSFFIEDNCMQRFYCYCFFFLSHLLFCF